MLDKTTATPEKQWGNPLTSTLKVLIIDDEPEMRFVLSHILQGAGHTVREAQDGREAIDEFRRKRPALIVPLYLRAAAKLGSTASLEKPFSVDALRSLVEDLLADRHEAAVDNAGSDRRRYIRTP